MRKIGLINLVCFFATTFYSYSQVSIGTPVIDNGVMLQLEAADKGLLLPRVALVSRTSTNPLPPSIPTGTLIFNTASTGVFPNAITPGLHWWSASEQQWTNINTNLENVILKYTNSERSTNYNTNSWQNVKFFGNKIINESTAVYQVDAANHTVKIGQGGLYSISSLFSFDRQNGGNSTRLSLNARVYVNGEPVGTEQVINPERTVSVDDKRGLFSHSFTEYLELKQNDIVSIRIRRTPGAYSRGYGDSVVNFLQNGDSSISILRIR